MSYSLIAVIAVCRFIIDSLAVFLPIPRRLQFHLWLLSVCVECLIRRWNGEKSNAKKTRKISGKRGKWIDRQTADKKKKSRKIEKSEKDDKGGRHGGRHSDRYNSASRYTQIAQYAGGGGRWAGNANSNTKRVIRADKSRSKNVDMQKKNPSNENQWKNG